MNSRDHSHNHSYIGLTTYVDAFTIRTLPETVEPQQLGIVSALDETRGYKPSAALSDDLASPDVASLFEDTSNRLQVYRGRSIAKRFGVAVQGSGATARGRINGSYTGHDYRAVYQVYHLPTSTSARYWFITYSRSSSTSELRLVNEQQNTTSVSYDLTFELQGNDTSVYIFYEAIS